MRGVSPKRPVLVLCALAVLALAAWVAWKAGHRLTVEEAARLAQGCLEKEDARCLYDLTMQEERVAYGLTSEKVDRFLKEYWRPRMRVASYGAVEYTPAGNNGQGMSTRKVLMQSGKEIGIGLDVAPTESGPKLISLMTSLMLTVAYAIYAGPAPPSALGAAKLRSWLTAAEADRQTLQGLGIDGVFRSPDEGLLPWDVWIESCTKRLAKAELAAAERGGNR